MKKKKKKKKKKPYSHELIGNYMLLTNSYFY